MLKLTFEMYKKVFFLIFFGYIKTENNYYLSYQEKHAKDIKIFLKKKNTTGEKRPKEDIEMLLKKKKKKDVKNFFLRNQNKR